MSADKHRPALSAVGSSADVKPAWLERLHARPRREKLNFVGAPAFFKLELACQKLAQAFGGWGMYHCGSSRQRRDWRDVDIRYVLDDKEFQELFPDAHENAWAMDPRWLILTISISDWLSKESGLPVDFQFQPWSHVQKYHNKEREPLGMNMVPRRRRRRRRS